MWEIHFHFRLFNEFVQTDLKSFIDEKSCTALNEIDKWQNAVLGNQPGMFRSDEDDPEVISFGKNKTKNIFSFLQLILHIAFNQIVKIHSIAIEAPEGKRKKLFVRLLNKSIFS